METKELMIGDKVIVKVPSQIPDTYVLHTWTANDYSRDIQVKPIPLTPEILENNGWWYEIEDMWLHDEVNFCIENGMENYNAMTSVKSNLIQSINFNKPYVSVV